LTIDGFTIDGLGDRRSIVDPQSVNRQSTLSQSTIENPQSVNRHSPIDTAAIVNRQSPLVNRRLPALPASCGQP
jgi:hypothetical protein